MFMTPNIFKTVSLSRMPITHDCFECFVIRLIFINITKCFFTHAHIHTCVHTCTSVYVCARVLYAHAFVCMYLHKRVYACR